MPLDVVDLRSFYASPLGAVAERYLSRLVRARWAHCAGLSLLGVGYATPYLRSFREEAERTLAFMPARQGVVNWPSTGLSSSALVDATMTPLPDSCIDRAIVIHALELAEQPRDLLEEVWRVLNPGGRLIVIAPKRGGLWSRVDTTPFGHGQPYSRGQLRELMRDSLFSPVYWDEALYAPPFARRMFLRIAPMMESFGARLALPGAGVLAVEATKQLYRPVTIRRSTHRGLPVRLRAPMPEPVGVGATTRDRRETI